MARWYVRTTGNDGTGTGTVLAPFLTIRKATQEWSAGDIIDVGPGTFVETAKLLYVARGLIIGAGYGSTIVQPVLPASGWVDVSVADVAALIVLANLTIEQTVPGSALIQAATVLDGFRVVLAHVVLKVDGYVVSNSTTGLTVDILNCVLQSRLSGRAGTAFWTASSTVLIRNSILTRLALVTDDSNAGTAIDSDYNVYFDNERELRIGAYGVHDIRDTDPKLSSASVPSRDSITRNAGVLLLTGYGADSRLLPDELVQDFGFDGPAPEIGVVETLEPSGARSVTAANVRTLLDCIGLENDTLRSETRQARLNRDIQTATATELQRRFATFLGVTRPAGQTDAQYREFLTAVLELSRSVAPARRAVERVVELLWASQPVILQHDRDGRFRLSTSLRLSAVHGAPSDNTLTLRVTAGKVLIDDIWYRIDQTDIVLDANATVAIVAGPAVDLLVDGTIGVTTADPSAQSGFLQLETAGFAVWRKGETAVRGIGTSFTTTLMRHDIVSIDGSLNRYVIEEVVDDATITLRTAVLDDDQNADVALYSSVAVLGVVTTNGSTITAIHAPGMLGVTTFADSQLARAHAFDVLIDDDGDIDVDTDAKLNSTIALLRTLSPVHKLVALSFLADYPAGKFVASVRKPSFTVVSYLEDIGDASWPTV